MEEEEVVVEVVAAPFVVSHPSHYLLPHSSFSLFIAFTPPACGFYRQRLRVVEVDRDGDADGSCDEEELEVEVELVLEGVSTEPALMDVRARSAAAAACSRVMAALHSDTSALLSSMVRGWVADAPAPRPTEGEQRAMFSRLNRSAALHFHPSLASAWWALWEDVRSLHRPLQRPSMQWNLHVERLQVAIQSLPARHRTAVPALQLRLDELRESARERPPIHPVRAALLSSVLSSIALAPTDLRTRPARLPPPDPATSVGEAQSREGTTGAGGGRAGAAAGQQCTAAAAAGDISAAPTAAQQPQPPPPNHCSAQRGIDGDGRWWGSVQAGSIDRGCVGRR